jgi:16S rRNA (uracil1498-N3)-methyltransferase
LELSGDTFHYLINVRRYDAGHEVPARTPAGRPMTLTLDRVDRESHTLVAHARRAAAEQKAQEHPEPPATAPRIFLYQGLAKGKKLDTVVRQATEAGVAAIIPVQTTHSVVDLDGERSTKRVRRLERVAREAGQQSGTAPLPRVGPIIDFGEIPPVHPDGEELGLVLHEKALARDKLHDYLRATPKRIYLAVGPEGGFSGEEITALTGDKNFVPIGLGTTVLRTETAAIYGIAAVQTVLRERNLWT